MNRQMRRWLRALTQWWAGVPAGDVVRVSQSGPPRLTVGERKLPIPQWRDVIASDPCVYCGGSAGTVDHLRPIALGGTNCWMNLAPACVTCNNQKAALSLVAFLVARRRYGARLSKVRPRLQTKAQRRLVAYLLKPDRCAPPLRYPLADKLIAAWRDRHGDEAAA